MDKEIQLINGKLQIAKSLTQKQHDAIIDFIKDFFKNKEGPAIVGISGGKDSTICAALLAEALGPERVIGVMMPNGEQADIDDSRKVCELLKIKSFEVNIGQAYNALFDAINVGKDLHECSLFTTNTPARLRMVTLYGVAAAFGGFVCNTCNASEDILGWSTYGGDTFGDFAPINQLTVTEVIALGDYMKLPKELVHKVPSDGMCGSTDEEKFGFTYEELDKWLLLGIKPKTKSIYEKILQMFKRSKFKLENIRLPHPDFGERFPAEFKICLH